MINYKSINLKLPNYILNQFAQEERVEKNHV